MAWEAPDQVPLTVYDWILPRGLAERLLREAGVGLIVRLPAHRVEHREVEILTREYREGARTLVRRTIRTPVGEVWQTLEADRAYGTSNWIREHFIKAPDDYRVMEFYFRDAVYRDNLDAIREADRRLGSDGVVMVRVAKAPLQEMLYQLMGYEQFAIDYLERRGHFDALHATMAKRYTELYELAAATPAPFVQLGDNISGDVVGRERFRTYLMPEYRRLRACLHGAGKQLAVHMDGRLKPLAEEIAAADVDIVEALTPPPMGDLSIKEARERWPGKALWVNFTSSVHVEQWEVIAAHARRLLDEAGTRRGFALSVTEDAPVEALERSLGVIAAVLREAR
jgi:hypothetical protein